MKVVSKSVVALLSAALLLAASSTAPAQGTSSFSQGDAPPPRWVGQFTVLSYNALVGGLTGGIVQELRGGSFRDGFTRGALGGGVVYLGKRLAVQDFDGAGLLGRELAAVGTSMVRNAADGAPTFARLMLPVGPLRLYVHTDGGMKLHAKLDLYALGYIGYAIAEEQLDFETKMSLSAGTAVFRARNLVIESSGEKAGGVEGGGTVLLSDYGEWGGEQTFAHERVHVLQNDYNFFTWNDLLEGWVLDKLGLGAVHRFADINITTELFLDGITRLGKIHHDDRPWELEASFLARK